MSQYETGRLQLPLVQPAQAQKHITVNEALMRLDGLVNLVLQRTGENTPPEAALDGACWGIGPNPTGVWAGQANRIAIGSNGGWMFAQPAAGMRAHLADRGCPAVHDGLDWVPSAITLTPAGSGMVAGFVEGEVSIGAGPSVESELVIPEGVMVIGAVARVVGTIGGTLSSWRLGTSGADDRFGRGLGTERGSWSRGLLGSPMTYYRAEPLILTAEGGSFSEGRVRIAVHWWELRLPAL